MLASEVLGETGFKFIVDSSPNSFVIGILEPERSSLLGLPADNYTILILDSLRSENSECIIELIDGRISSEVYTQMVCEVTPPASVLHAACGKTSGRVAVFFARTAFFEIPTVLGVR